MQAGVCVRFGWKVFLLQRASSAAIILAATRLIWMGAYCTSEGPIKLIKKTFHCYCDGSQIFYTRRYGKSLGIHVLFGEGIIKKLFCIILIKTKC